MLLHQKKIEKRKVEKFTFMKDFIKLYLLSNSNLSEVWRQSEGHRREAIKREGNKSNTTRRWNITGSIEWQSYSPPPALYSWWHMGKIAQHTDGNWTKKRNWRDRSNIEYKQWIKSKTFIYLVSTDTLTSRCIVHSWKTNIIQYLGTKKWEDDFPTSVCSHKLFV